MERLQGRVAVVTGAASGIGFGLSKRFAEEGMRVVMSDIERPVLERAAEEVRALGVEVLAVPTDVAVAAEVEALAAATMERFGEVHVLCNNAGVGSRGLRVGDIPLRDYEWVLGVNLFGVINGVHHFLPHLKLQDEAHIVNTGSVNSLTYPKRMAPYNASKAAVMALSETLLFELEEQGLPIGVSVLCPNLVRTNISQAVRNLPERLSYEITTEQAEESADYKAKRRAQVTAAAMEPSELADKVLAAIYANRFYILTHEGSEQPFADRAARIVAGANPSTPDRE